MKNSHFLAQLQKSVDKQVTHIYKSNN